MNSIDIYMYKVNNYKANMDFLKKPADLQQLTEKSSLVRQWPGIGTTLERHPFSGGSDFHGHRPAVYINTTPFMVSDERQCRAP